MCTLSRNMHTERTHATTRTLTPTVLHLCTKGETTMGIAHLCACKGRSYSGPIRLTPNITVRAVHCNGLHPSLDLGQQNMIWMMTCAPLIFPEDLKLLLKEELAKLCPPGIVPREYEAI